MMSEIDAVDIVYEKHPLIFMTGDERDQKKQLNMVKAACNLDAKLDSPLPRWVIDTLLCRNIGWRIKAVILLTHHKMICGQDVPSYITSKWLDERLRRSIKNREAREEKLRQIKQKLIEEGQHGR